MANQMLVVLLGGALLLIYGVRVAGQGLKTAAGAQIKNALSQTTRNRFLGLLVGIVVAFFLQSSSSTSVMLVSFVDSGLVLVSQTLAVLLGAGIGATLTVQLISFKLYDYAIGIAGLGLLLMFVSRSAARKALGESIFGFGLIFLSIKIISDTMAPLKENELFQQILLTIGREPVLMVLLSGALTGLMQSSAATMGLALSLALNHLIDLRTALPIMLGANLGTISTPFLASLRTRSEARQVSTAQVIFKVLGVLIFIPFLPWFQKLVELTSQSFPHQIANAHTIFNCIVALLFIPFTGPVYKLVLRLSPARKEVREERFGPKYLNPELLQTPSLALAAATREAMRLAEIVQDMLAICIRPFADPCPDPEMIEKIEQMDDKVDILDREIRFYLTHVSRNPLAEEDAKREMEILNLIYNLESLGDVIDKNLMELAKKKCRKEASFSKEGKDELIAFHQKIYQNLVLGLSAFATRDETIAQQVLRNKSKIRDLEQEYYQNHLRRLEEGLAESFETSRIHLDVLSNLRRINSYITNIAYPIVTKPKTAEKE
jgi:phosphate:Na+ symporter